MYLPSEDFDPLSRLFLEVLHHERSIKRLVRAFGLTERVVEDVLGDLIRRNRVALVIKDDAKELRLLDDAVPNLVRDPGEPLDVWQDRVTGVVLPAWVIDKFDQRRFQGDSDGAATPLLLSSGPPLIEDFINAPDAQLIEMLIRADVELREREDSYGILDRLVDRFRVRPQTLLLPIVEAKFQDYRIPQIASDDLPGWVARIWSVALRKQELRPADGERKVVPPTATIATSEPDAFQIMDGWRAAAHLNSWRSAVHRFLRLVPAPMSGYELREVREHQAALRALYLSVARIELVTEQASLPDESWFESALDGAREWTVLILPWPGQVEFLIKCIRKRADSKLNIPNTVIVVLPIEVQSTHEAALNSLVGVTRSAPIIKRRWPVTGPSIILCDIPRVHVRYSSRSALIQCEGERLASEWLTTIQTLPMPKGDPENKEISNLLRSLRIRRVAIPESENVRLGAGADGPTIGAALNELRAFGESLLTAIVDPELVMREAAGRVEVTPSVQVTNFDRQQSLLQQLPVLLERLDVLSHYFSLSPAPPFAFWTRLNAYELGQAMIAMLTEPGRRSVQGQISILTQSIGLEALSPDLLNLIDSAVVAHGWSIQVGIFVSRAQRVDQLNAAGLPVRGRIPSSRLRFFALNQPVSAYALIIDDVVFMSSIDWFQSVLQQGLESTNFGFAIESRELAESFRTYFVGAPEMWSAATHSLG
jgi:hypothetical protein